MSLPRTAVDLVPGDIEGLLAAAATHSDLARKVRETKLQLASVVEASAAHWSGPASTGFRAAGGAQATQLQEVVPLAQDAAEAYQTLGTALRALRAEAADVLTASERLGLPAADLTGNPIAVVQHIVSEPADAIAIVHLLALIVAVRVRVGDAHNAFVVAIARTTTLSFRPGGGSARARRARRAADPRRRPHPARRARVRPPRQRLGGPGHPRAVPARRWRLDHRRRRGMVRVHDGQRGPAAGHG